MTIANGTNRLNRPVTVFLRRPEAKSFFNAVEQFLRRNFGDANGAVTLHVGVAAQRADAGAFFTNIAAHQQQVSDLLHVLRAVLMLGNAHAITDDGSLRTGVQTRNVLDFLTFHARHLQDVIPVGGIEIGFQRVKTFGVFVDEGFVDHARLARRQRIFMHAQQQLHHAFQHGGITTDAHFVVG